MPPGHEACLASQIFHLDVEHQMAFHELVGGRWFAIGVGGNGFFKKLKK